jgi:glycosyltransferase involved in cell wall biosynthesis
MAEVDVIAERAEPAIREQGTADILIAVPTFNNENTIGAVLNAACTALLQFPQRKALIAHLDGGSTDSTVQRAKDSLQGAASFAQLSYPVYPIHRLELSHHSVPGKDSAYRTIFFMAQELDVKACCIVGGDAILTPDWIASLVQPILEMGFDLAAPSYQGPKCDGLLVKTILYPLLRALFGKGLKQPIGSDFGYSPKLIRQCLQETWNNEAARRDIDLWIDVQAVQNDLKLCQVYLGFRPRSVKEGGQDVSSILSNLVGAVYLEMERTAELWQRVRGSNPVPTVGLRYDPETDEQVIDVKPMIHAFRIGFANLQDIWALALPPATVIELKRLSRQAEDQFRFPAELWARVVYDFAVAHRLRLIGRDHLLRALTPLYMGCIASVILNMLGSNNSQNEDEIEQICLAYEAQKPYLISRWRWPDRFTP